MSAVTIDYFPDFQDLSEEEKNSYLEHVQEATPIILTTLQWLRDRNPEYFHTVIIQIPSETTADYLSIHYQTDVEAEISLHDYNYGDDYENEIGLVQVQGLYTRTVERELQLREKMKKGIMEILE